MEPWRPDCEANKSAWEAAAVGKMTGETSTVAFEFLNFLSCNLAPARELWSCFYEKKIGMRSGSIFANCLNSRYREFVFMIPYICI